MYRTKITYQVEGGNPAVAILENVHGHPMEGDVEWEDFGIWFQANGRNCAYWGAQAYDLITHEDIASPEIQILEISFPKNLTK